MSSIRSDHGMPSANPLDEHGLPTPSTRNARTFKLLWILPRLIWHIPCRRINGKVRYEGMLSFKPAIRRRFHLASDGKFSELYDLYLRNVADFTQFRADHPLDDTKDMSMESKADRFCALIEANEYSKANGLLHSSGLAPASEETHEQLQKLIVQRSAEDSARIQETLTAPSRTTSATRRISFSHKDVKRALRKLHKFTAAGGSGWRNEFLKTLEDCSREQPFDVAHFFELLVNNRLQLYQEFSAVVRLVPLRKKERWHPPDRHRQAVRESRRSSLG